MFFAKKILLSSCAVISFAALVSQPIFAMDNSADGHPLVSRTKSNSLGASSSQSDDASPAETSVNLSTIFPSNRGYLSQECEKHVNLAREAYAAKDYKGSIPPSTLALKLLDAEGNFVLTGIERVQILRNLGLSYESTGKCDPAISSYTEALGMNDDHGHHILTGVKRAKALCNLGICHNLKGKYDEAISSYTEALGMKDDQGHHILTAAKRAKVLCNLGISYGGKREYDAAISSLTEALDMKDDKGCDVWKAAYLVTVEILNILGDCYHQEGKYDEAIFYHLKVLDMKDDRGCSVLADDSRARTSRMLESAFKGESDPMISFGRLALNLQDTQGNNVCTGTNRAKILSHLGDAYFTHNSRGAAIHHYREALQLPGNNENEFAFSDEERASIRQKIEQLIPLLD